MPFVQTSGTKFTLNGQPWYLFGCTVYADLYYWNSSTMPAKLDAVVAGGFNTIRFTNYANLALGLEYDEQVYSYLDSVLDGCRTRNLKVIFETSQINSFSGFHRDNPTPNTDMSYDWGGVNFYKLWHDYYNWLANRVNTVNGRVYKNDDTIAMYAIAGELGEPFGYSTGLGPFYTTVSGYIRAADPNHLICPAAMNPEQIYDSSYPVHPTLHSADILSISTIDCAATEGYYDAYIGVLYPELKSYSTTKNKPWFVIEFGYDQNYFNEQYRARRLRYVYDQGLKNDCAGFIFWNYDGGQHGGYGINPNTQESWNMVKTYAQTSFYSPRLKVI